MYNFSITDEQAVTLDLWVTEQNKISVAAQKKNPPRVPRDLLESCWEDGYPYGGAIGGNLTFSFTPTSLGVVVTVTDSLTKETIDLTIYEHW